MEDIQGLQGQITKQGEYVRQLKKDGKHGTELTDDLKAKLAEAIKIEEAKHPKFDKDSFDALMKSRMFIVPSFEIYGGVAGLFDFGPTGCALKHNLIQLWRQFFVLEENMLEMECTNLTPFNVLKTSGHVEKFSDLMVKDVKTGECFRADKLLEARMDELISQPTTTEEQRKEYSKIQLQAGSYEAKELDEMLKKYEVKAPGTKNDLTEPYPFNLMFQTQIGPQGDFPGFLRPETAQGLFVNFRRLLDYNGKKIPFAAAQIGIGFRNEISPRAGLLRVREFAMAEIEHFVNPEDKSHKKFYKIKSTVLPLFPADHQMGDGKIINISAEEAVEKGIIGNETLAYFMSRTYMFLMKIGIDSEKLRFRQHLKTEMAHYAKECWDAEILLSYGWTECVGHADRACFDLTHHAEATNIDLQAAQPCAPYPITFYKPDFDNAAIGKAFKKDQGKVKEAIIELGENHHDEVEKFMKDLEEKGEATWKEFTLTKNMIKKFNAVTKTVNEKKFAPGVIEPSFGVGRVLYSVLEHSYYVREGDEKRNVLKFKPCMAPTKCGIIPLKNVKKEEEENIDKYCDEISHYLNHKMLSNVIDDSSVSIGKKYARLDEIGTPFAVTVDCDTLSKHFITLRERDSMTQVRIPVPELTDDSNFSELASILHDLCSEHITWENILSKFENVKAASN